MAKLKLLYLIVLVILSCNLSGQNNEIDSLILILKHQKDDTNKVNTLNNLSWENLSMGDYEKSIENSKNALLLAEKLKYKKGIANAYNNLGNTFSDRGELNEAKIIMKRLLK